MPDSCSAISALSAVKCVVLGLLLTPLVAKAGLGLQLLDRGFFLARRLAERGLHFGFIEWF